MSRTPPLMRDLEMRRPGFPRSFTQLDPHRYRYMKALPASPPICRWTNSDGIGHVAFQRLGASRNPLIPATLQLPASRKSRL